MNTGELPNRYTSTFSHLSQVSRVLPQHPGGQEEPPWKRKSTPMRTHTCSRCCSEMVKSQYPGGRQLLDAKRKRSGRARLLYPLPDPKANPRPQGSPCPSGKSFACTKSGFRTSKHIYISANSTTRLTCRPEGGQLTGGRGLDVDLRP